ncbi:leukocyte immunoglobulin-like receptor subfamily A member 3 [Esox lucius]|uniref:leukocyte immunoglobulin-like receptor subfamily A member 3 n=1 Tax=Esox lucius TaxID=8010 RepID=UPI001476E56D|nr:leukocyte immunoglobulin-like receptor subfamily A member 3 [Esox lucius]
MEHSWFCLLLFLTTFIYCGHSEDDALPSATLTVDPNPVFIGETVTLTCSVNSEGNWRYTWDKDRPSNTVTPSGRHSITGGTLIISRVEMSDQGSYWCLGERKYTSTSTSTSNQVTISVKALPKATLTVDPNPVFTGEKVTLTCSVESVRYWRRYVWYKDNTFYPNRLSQYNRATLTINSVKESDKGLYYCQGISNSRPTSSSISNYVTLSVYGEFDLFDVRFIESIMVCISMAYFNCPFDPVYCSLPKVTLTVDPNPVFTGEKVTLTCSVGSYSVWTRYDWYKYNTFKQNRLPQYSGTTLTINSVKESDQGLYWCRGFSNSRPRSSSTSNQVTITVNALPNSTLSIEPTSPYTGENVTLTCSAGSDSDWRYKWYKDRSIIAVNQSDRHSTTGDTLIISRVEESDQGLYWCQGERKNTPTSTSISNQVNITVKAQPKSMLALTVNGDKVHSDKEDVLTGDRVTLTCTVESSGWRFYWYRDRTDSPPVSTTESTYTFNPVSVSDGGQYWCRGGRGEPPYYTLNSDPVRITVTERPVAVLTIQPNWTQIFIGETVTLRCVLLGGGDTDWQYEWFHYQNIIQTEPEYRISPVRTSHNGSYRCRGVKGRKTSNHSDVVQLTVSALPIATLTVDPNIVFPGEKVTLTCSVESDRDWTEYEWYKDNKINRQE